MSDFLLFPTVDELLKIRIRVVSAGVVLLHEVLGEIEGEGGRAAGFVL